METQALDRLEALRKRNVDRDWLNSDLYRLLYRPDLYEVAYEKIRSSPGNMTAGTDGITLDGFSYAALDGIIRSLRDESFQFKPARREYIPKANGKMRPLGIPSPRDKIVQEVIHMILEAIYDSPHGAFFLDCSHGFRPNRGCHTALREFGGKWKGVTWIIEGDIKSCFDEIDHHVLISLLRRKIADERFTNLIWKSLRAGYLWKRERYLSLLGSPQGSICSPILANVYLHELDCFVERLKRRHERGQRRKHNPEYMQVAKKRQQLLKQSEGQRTPEIEELTKRLRSLPSKVIEDPDFVRIKYLRYADDWILGIIGPRTLAVSIRDEIKSFLKDILHLELSIEKTHIRHARTEEAFFLGTRLSIGGSKTQEAKIGSCRSRNGRRYRKRVTGWNPVMKAPTDKLVERLHQKGFCSKNGYPTSKAGWTLLDADQILNLFNSINRGLLNYYRFVHNFASLARIQYILRHSLAMTLAHKYRMTVGAVFRKHGRNLCFRWPLPNGKFRELQFAENTDWRKNTNAFMVNPEPKDIFGWQVTLREKSKLGFPCLVCGCEENVEMHHVRHIRKMGDRKPTGFRAVMRALNRKQIPVCASCHRKIHNGEYDGIRLSDLAYDFKAQPT